MSANRDGAEPADEAAQDASNAIVRVPDGIKLPDGTRWEGHHVRLERFEGPLDLLLELVREKQIPICDIPISEITDQFLIHVKTLQAALVEDDGDLLDAAGDFLVMAACLIQLKTRELLPADENEKLDEEELTREDLNRLLEEYERFKAAAQSLNRKMQERSRIFMRTRPAVEPEQEEILKVDLSRLLDAFRLVLRRAPEKEVQEMAREPIRIEERIVAIRLLLEQNGSVLFSELFDSTYTRGGMIATFLAILEMMRSGELIAVQHEILGDIRLARSEEPNETSVKTSIETPE